MGPFSKVWLMVENQISWRDFCGHLVNVDLASQKEGILRLSLLTKCAEVLIRSG